MKLNRCDECKVDIPEGVQFIEIQLVAPYPTLSMDMNPKQFCNALCVAVYHARMCGKEVK